MRGTESCRLTHPAQRRFIPAHAGNRPRSVTPLTRGSVHPRACGEQNTPRRCSHELYGSSPRMRGTGGSIGRRGSFFRFIPAHAGNSIITADGRILTPVHPRACGEQDQNRSAHSSRGGSSPRMRGTEQSDAAKRMAFRFIPAHAGNSGNALKTFTPISVHPRACGEQLCDMKLSSTRGGSSPRMRGTGTWAAGSTEPQRFIPAHAGNRVLPRWGFIRISVHPRACGEQGCATVGDGSTSGSSPRMRGTEANQKAGFGKPRFIPAHAGNRDLGGGFDRASAVHPRACGEQTHFQHQSNCPAGSSPRMRGTARCWRWWRRRGRFIPAHAGNRAFRRMTIISRPVHPRACGEQDGTESGTGGRGGSSPRMRGTGHLAFRYGAFIRFIPAHAGNRHHSALTEGNQPVHPRACGEQFMRPLGQRQNIGSSPRMRGTGTAVRETDASDRFIPAHAGNSPIGQVLSRRCPVHPRACGEQRRFKRSGVHSLGSSPRMRGTGTRCRAICCRGRFIPAHAGNRKFGRRCIRVRAVHPRACGEQGSPLTVRARSAGSSPRMRGTV